MFCSTPQRLAKIKSYEYEINGKKKLETTTTKKMYEVAGNPDLKRSNNKRQRMPLGHETRQTCSPIKILLKVQSLNLATLEPSALDFSTQSRLIITYHLLDVILSHYLIIVFHALNH